MFAYLIMLPWYWAGHHKSSNITIPYRGIVVIQWIFSSLDFLCVSSLSQQTLERYGNSSPPIFNVSLFRHSFLLHPFLHSDGGSMCCTVNFSIYTLNKKRGWIWDGDFIGTALSKGICDYVTWKKYNRLSTFFRNAKNCFLLFDFGQNHLARRSWWMSILQTKFTTSCKKYTRYLSTRILF